ncbi:MAG: hypothetical protein WA802_06410 [Terracidiphilus sp.]
MIRYHICRNARIVPALIVTAIFFSLSLASLAQPGTEAQQNTKPQPDSTTAQQSTTTAPPPATASAPQPITGMMQPSLNTVHQTLAALRLDKWKKGSIRDEAEGNINAIQHDLQANLPSLLRDADAASGAVSKLLPVSRHVDALYDVLLRITEASRVVGPDDQAAQLQQALLSLGNARLALDDRLQGSAGALEKQVTDLRTSIATEAARRASEPKPVALPCVPSPPPVHKAVKKRTPAAKPATSATPSATPQKTSGTQPPTSH